MNITKHALHRYVERILKIPTRQQQAYEVSQKESELAAAIEKMLCESKFIYRGVVSEGKTAMSFYLYTDNETVIVTDFNEEVVVTIYKITFAFPEQLKQTVILGLSNEIAELAAAIEEEQTHYNAVVESSYAAIELQKAKINELNFQISVCNNQIAEIEKNRNAQQAKLIALQKRQAVYVTQLLANTDLKELEKEKK